MEDYRAYFLDFPNRPLKMHTSPTPIKKIGVKRSLIFPEVIGSMRRKPPQINNITPMIFDKVSLFTNLSFQFCRILSNILLRGIDEMRNYSRMVKCLQ